MASAQSAGAAPPDRLAPFAHHYADRHAAAEAWKQAGGKVVGYLCDNVPDELITAAGFFPLRVSGAPGLGSERVRRKIDRLFPPDVPVRPAFVTAMLERLLSGAYDLLDYLIRQLALIRAGSSRDENGLTDLAREFIKG